MIEAWKASNPEEPVWLVKYSPLAECFFQGDDPLHTARSTPGVLWGKVENDCATQDINDLDPYQCVSTFTLLSSATEDELHEHYRYVAEQTDIEESRLSLRVVFRQVFPHDRSLEALAVDGGMTAR